MRLLKSSEEGFIFHVSRRDKELLLALLKLYPRMPPGHSKLHRSTVDPANQALLEEALAEQRAENQKNVQRLLANPAKWTQSDHGWRLTLTGPELEWLLQVLNDIRVGSWVLVGAPEEELRVLNEETGPHLWAMEVAGRFQMALLGAFEGK